MARYIHPNHKVECHFCHADMDHRDNGVYAYTMGWVKNRQQGGGNAIALAEKPGVYACKGCIEAELAGNKRFQGALF